MYNWNEIDLLWRFEAQKNRKYKKYFDHTPKACFKEHFLFLLKALLDPSPSCYKPF